MHKIIDIAGQRFGRLKVVKFIERINKKSLFECICDCGNIKNIDSKNLKKGTTKSCGCLSKENSIQQGLKNSKTHGKTNTKLYHKWIDIKNRCYNKNDTSYKHYGGRGIVVCNEWKNDFQTFYDWAMANGYSDNLTIDRIDNSLGYSPENCRWATRKEQANNRRSNKLLKYNGKTQNLTQWANELCINYDVLRNRLKRGWSIEKTLSLPNKKVA